MDGILCVYGNPTMDNNGESCDMHLDNSDHKQCVARGFSTCELSFQRWWLRLTHCFLQFYLHNHLWKQPFLGPWYLHVSSILTFSTIQLLFLCFKAMLIGVPCHVMPNALGVSPHYAYLIMMFWRLHQLHLDHNTNKVKIHTCSLINVHFLM